MLCSLPRASIHTLHANSHAKIAEHAQSFCPCVRATDPCYNVAPTHAHQLVFFSSQPFSSPEPTILLACGRNRELWEQPSWSNHFGHAPQMTTELNRMDRIRLLPLLFQNGCSQSSRFLLQARRIVGSGDENE